MNETTWPPEWTRATLAQSVLAIIAAEGTTYGYQIIQRLGTAGFPNVKGGTLYPILARLEAEGWTSTAWGEGSGGPGRKFVSITDSGLAEVERFKREWQIFSEMIVNLWTGETGGDHESS